MTASKPAVLFDIDGTLVDTNWFHTVSWWRAFRDIGEEVSMSRIHPLIGMGSDQLVERLIGHESEEASEAHSKHYEPFKDEITSFPGAADLLKEVAQRGALVVLATSSDEKDLERLQEAVGAGDAVDHVISKDDVGASKPAPDIFAAALDQMHLDPDRTMVVGDTAWDVAAAKKLGLCTVCVLTGGATREQLKNEGAVAVYEDVNELLSDLDSSPLGKLLEYR
ncbi:MAG: HAD family hydrolase [Actinomycetota bacterium]|nr:HAD family hydrolase [Actinomycetota bacterium]